MRIVTWNCNGAFRKKFSQVAGFDADIYVIQECENPAESGNPPYQRWAKNHIWTGDTKNKGLAVFARPEIDLEKLDWSNRFEGHFVKHFLPCRINRDFELLAVWTHRNNSPNFGYIGQFWKYLQVNKARLNTSIVAGDFNSNAIWDEWDRWWNHPDVVNALKQIGIESLYHAHTGEQQGKETKATLFFQRKRERPYHIDYVFASKKFRKRLKKFEIGQVGEWLEFSDHMPIFCEIDM
ncbi:Exonuclease III [Cyclobacterium xiamenense]|uniref:Exonuclease III n=1 Tax=Cyclobacterium xiamenense TaxID=1297121 RepID=A0A1H6T6K1_9BACT|nr:endonuclease/exonuclease/phosphatase family protein [Cyclobacterium xiamenense]SEI75713.1 Exonuclease III [Cyclobacterium xiamenense]